MSLRDGLKRGAERLLAGLAGRPRRMAGRALILAYHNVVPDEDAGRGDASLHLPQSAFLAQLDLLARHCAVRPLAEVLEGEVRPDRPTVAITFDDAYAGAVEWALPLLASREMPATLFVAPGILGSPSLWWDELAESPEGLTPERRREALEVHAGDAARIRAAYGAAGAKGTLPASYACASEAQVRALGAHGALTLGAHSWSHANLARIGARELEQELVAPLEWLSTNPGRAVPMVAYPYGLSSTLVGPAADAAGYRAGLRVVGGWLPPAGTGRWAVPRLNVPAGLSAEGYALRLAGHFAA